MIILTESVFAKDPVWFNKMKQIRLLKDNRENIIKLLGNPVDNDTDDYLWYYDFKDGRMSLTFETGICSENKDDDGKPIGWKVPEWTVVEVSFSPDKNFSTKKLNINLSGFTKKPIEASPNLPPNDNNRAPFLFEYKNDDLGMYLFEEFGKISEIRFYPSHKYNELRCQ